jgi:deoxyadenosine/deoxycytidine kinase
MAGRRFSPSKVRRIEIAGGIASGKTTMARLLNSDWVKSVYEQFRKNPFFEAFYEDPVHTALETELTFLLQHYHAEKSILKEAPSYCADFSLLLDRAYAAVTLPPRDQRLFELISNRLEKDLPRRVLTIYLECSPVIQLKRIKRRNRVAERTITLDYLKRVDAALRSVINKTAAKETVITIDSGLIDFAHKSSAISGVLAHIESAITRT